MNAMPQAPGTGPGNVSAGAGWTEDPWGQSSPATPASAGVQQPAFPASGAAFPVNFNNAFQSQPQVS